jgi:hypothetical protein
MRDYMSEIFLSKTSYFQDRDHEWQITLASSYNLIRIVFYICSILFFPFLIIKSESLSQKFFWSGIYAVVLLFGTHVIRPIIRRYFFAWYHLPEDFLQVNQNGITLPMNYVRPYTNKLSDDQLHIPITSILKICYLEKVARSQEGHVYVLYRLPNGEEYKLLLYSSEFINGREDLEAFYSFFIGKVPTDRMDFLR